MLIALNKPFGLLSQFSPEPNSRWQSLAVLKLPPRVYPIGRLDADSEGLLLLSDESGPISSLLDPRNAHPREYWVQVERIPSAASLIKLNAGLEISRGQRCLPCKASLLNPPPEVPPRTPPIRYRENVPDCWISLELREGKNRQVRRMTAAIGHPTLRLIRVRIGGLTLQNLALHPGEWCKLTPLERKQALSSPSVLSRKRDSL